MLVVLLTCMLMMTCIFVFSVVAYAMKLWVILSGGVVCCGVAVVAMLMLTPVLL